MRNTAEVIRETMRMKKITVTQLTKKLKITPKQFREELSKMSPKGNSDDTKTFIKKICKVINVPPTFLMLKSLELKDIPKDKKELFKDLYPSIDKMVNIVIKSKGK